MAVCMQSELGRWLQEFHTTVNKSYAGSLHYLKTLSNVALSSVLYNRGAFPDTSYSVECCDGQIIPMLKKRSNCPKANEVHSWITGFQDAIDKKYLRTAALTFYDAEQPEIPIEETRIKFKYSEDNVTFNSSGETSSIREDTLNFLKATTEVAKSFGEFPKRFLISMNLTFYEDVTPADYEPPGFSAGEGTEEPEEVPNWKRILIGSVATPCHKIGMVASKVLPSPSPSQSTSKSGKDHNAESEESDPIGNSQIKDKENYDGEVEASFSGDLQITASPNTTQQSTRHKRAVERSTPVESFSHKRKKMSNGKVNWSKNRRLHNN